MNLKLLSKIDFRKARFPKKELHLAEKGESLFHISGYSSLSDEDILKQIDLRRLFSVLLHDEQLIRSVRICTKIFTLQVSSFG